MATKQPARPAKKKTPGSVGMRRVARAGKPAVPAPVGARRVKVRATQMGFYGLKRRREGDVFYISGKRNEKGDLAEFSRRWMEIVDTGVPLKETGAQEALNKKHDEILGGIAKRKGKPADDVESDDDPDDFDDDVEQ